MKTYVELKPCPFCGTQPYFRGIFISDGVVCSPGTITCTECAFTMESEQHRYDKVDKDSEALDAELATRWNRRA